jgi:asparagine synthase (glutamine-hydrolysing)
LGEKNTAHIKKLLGKEIKEKSFWDSCDIVDLSETLGIKDPALKNELDMVTTAYHSTVMDGNMFHCAEKHFDIEYRHPFFDKELVEFSLSLPPEMKYGNRTIKRILRKAMKDILPEKIRRRKDKAEFSEIIRQQIAAIDVDMLLADANIVKLGLLTQEDVALCKQRYEEGHPYYVSYFWVMLNVEYWYRANDFEAPTKEEER